MDNVCQAHIVNNCPLCKQGQIPAPIPIPETEVERTVAGQRPYGAPPLSEPGPVKFADKKAISVVELADLYARAVQEVADIDRELKELEMQVLAAKIKHQEVSKQRDDAQRKLFELVAPPIKESKEKVYA